MRKICPPSIPRRRWSNRSHPQLTVIPAMLKLEQRYKGISIVAPENDTAVRQNAGNVSIKVAIEPFLFNERGDLLAIYMDGIEVSRGRATSVQLVEVDRGTHVVRAEIVDADGKILKKANPVTFTLHRHSRLFNPN